MLYIDRREMPCDIAGAKRYVRSAVRRALKETTEEYRSTASAAMMDRFTSMEEYGAAKIILAYWSVGAEPDTHAVIERMLADGKTVCLPRCIDMGQNGRIPGAVPEMEAREICSAADMIPGAYGILEPGEGCALIRPEEIDLMLMPCLACDTSCRRIGHGAGYYDRYLGLVRDDCCKAALCYEAVLADELPVEEHDKPVDAVLTEERIIFTVSTK